MEKREIKKRKLWNEICSANNFDELTANIRIASNGNCHEVSRNYEIKYSQCDHDRINMLSLN